MLGCSFLYPAVLPTPHISSFILSKTDEFFIIANNLLWQVIDIKIDYLFQKKQYLSFKASIT